ncbi:FAD/NAD(P)-binding domain-containing protein [Aspergillus pseudoustus]|uniref:FAD/NAD(P)-binding domain-containing protein n=1 Tax=Aspergillus pseudoustus TaxID=1810923 RepID=A0ABR4ITC4_9EURO
MRSIDAPKPQPYRVREEPLGTTRHLRIITIGAGISGLNMIRTLRKTMTEYSHIVYEKNPDVGGTWHENRYPGCECDHPSHSYQFTWRKNPRWSRFSAGAREIEQYLLDVCEEESLRSEIRTSHQVVGAQWERDAGQWVVTVKDLSTNRVFEDRCQFLLNATGILNNWKWPDIPGLTEFAGERVHSAAWPDDFQYHGKRVAVIGNGSSGVQIVPAIQPDVQRLVHFVRSPTWIAPPQTERMLQGEILQSAQMDGNLFKPEQKERFANDREYYQAFIRAIEEQVNARFRTMVNNDGLAEILQRNLEQHMASVLKDRPDLIKAVIPTGFPAGCRRLTPGPGYLESLTSPNVRVVTQSIRRVLPRGIELTTGEIIELDCIICATGFDVSFCPRFPIIGANRCNLQDQWKRDLPAAYMSCAVAGMPNYFMFMGPNAPIGHGSVVSIAEQVAKYIVRMLKKCQTEGIKSIVPKASAVQEFTQHARTFLPRTIWAGNCRSWYKNGTVDGPIIALHPGSRIHWFHMMEIFRPEDYDYEYLCTVNRFHFLGNGFSAREAGRNPTWYLESLSDYSKF